METKYDYSNWPEAGLHTMRALTASMLENSQGGLRTCHSAIRWGWGFIGWWFILLGLYGYLLAEAVGNRDQGGMILYLALVGVAAGFLYWQEHQRLQWAGQRLPHWEESVLRDQAELDAIDWALLVRNWESTP